MPSPLTRFLAAVALVAGSAGVAAADPALFVARDADTTLYVFGTIHYVPCENVTVESELGIGDGKPPADPGCAEWMTDTVADALAASDEFWIETVDILDVNVIAGLVQELGYFDDELLTDYIAEDELLLVLEGLAGDAFGGAVPPDLYTMKPWLLTMLLGELSLIDGGASATQGVDLTMSRLAGELGIPVHGLETAEDQLRLVAGDPLEVQVADFRSTAVFFRHGLDLFDISQWSFEQMWEFWSAGDLYGVTQFLVGDDEAFFARYEDELAALLDISEAELLKVERELNAIYEDVGLPDPEQRAIDSYESLIATRNRNWMIPIRDMLDRPGTFFVAVGAGHLAGDAALQTLIEQEGVAVERIQ